MSRYVALFRGINVGGNRKVPMASLRAFFSDLGFDDVKTLLQTGNVVFDAPAIARPEQLESRIEVAARRDLGLDTDVHVRGARDWPALVAGNPFPDAALRDPSHLVVQFLKGTPPASAARALGQAIRGHETAEIRGRHAYVFYPDGIGTSKLTAAVLDRALGLRGTARNWNTVLKLGALLAGGG